MSVEYCNGDPSGEKNHSKSIGADGAVLIAGNLQVPVRSQGVGSDVIASGSLAGWKNVNSLDIIQQSYWGAGANNKYVVDLDSNNDALAPFLISQNSSINQEVRVFCRRGIIYLRIQDNRSIFIDMNGEGDVLTIGVARNVETGTIQRLAFENYNFLTDAQALGYDRNQTENDVWTFGIDGFDLYFKYNGILLKTFRQWGLYQPLPGKIGLASQTNYGFRDIQAYLLQDPVNASDMRNNSIDLTDLGVKSLKTIGTINAASNSLTVANPVGFSVGDKVVIEIGTETGKGRQGTKGVGGTWPALSYPDVGAMNADTTQTTDTIAWVEDTGRVYQYVNCTWRICTDTGYYTYRSIPLSWVAEITGISDNVFTLNTNATVTATNANVYFANDETLFKQILGVSAAVNGNPARTWLPPNVTVTLPTGNFAIVDPISVNYKERSNWKLQGKGSDTILFSPKGVQSATITVNGVDNFNVENLTLIGNARLTGFGFTDIAMRASSPQTSFPTGGLAYPGGVVYTNCRRGLVANVRVEDVWQQAVGFRGCSDCVAKNISVNMTQGLFIYVQWLLQISDSARCSFFDCDITSEIMTAGFECFRSTGTKIVNLKGKNVAGAVNGSGDWLYENIDLVLDKEIVASNGSWSTSNPLININTNIQPPNADLALGGTIRNLNVRMREPLNENDYAPIMINININNVNVTVEGTYDGTNIHHPAVLIGPDAAPYGSSMRGTIAVNSTAEGTIVRNIRVRGVSPREASAGTGFANINVSGKGSQVIDCVADRVQVFAPAIETGTRDNASNGSGP